jgi:hypothetical protein
MRHLIYLLVVANLVVFLWHAVLDTSDGALESALPPLPPGVRPLVTLEERGRAQAAGTATAESLTASQPPGAGMSLTCNMLGPFMTTTEIEPVGKRLAQLGYRAERYATEEKSRIGYWIYLPPMEREKALEITRMLGDKGDREYYIGKDNLVALGAFREMPRVEKRLKRVRELGLDPVVEPRYKTHTVYWLDLEGLNVDASDLEAIVKEFPDIQLQGVACQ